MQLCVPSREGRSFASPVIDLTRAFDRLVCVSVTFAGHFQVEIGTASGFAAFLPKWSEVAS